MQKLQIAYKVAIERNQKEVNVSTKPLSHTAVFTPMEFYEKQFPDDANLIHELQNKPFFSLASMVQFTELYANYLRSLQL